MPGWLVGLYKALTGMMRFPKIYAVKILRINLCDSDSCYVESSQNLEVSPIPDQTPSLAENLGCCFAIACWEYHGHLYRLRGSGSSMQMERYAIQKPILLMPSNTNTCFLSTFLDWQRLPHRQYDNMVDFDWTKLNIILRISTHVESGTGSFKILGNTNIHHQRSPRFD